MDQQEREELLAALNCLHRDLLDIHSLAWNLPTFHIYEATLRLETDLIRLVKWIDPALKVYGLPGSDRRMAVQLRALGAELLKPEQP